MIDRFFLFFFPFFLYYKILRNLLTLRILYEEKSTKYYKMPNFSIYTCTHTQREKDRIILFHETFYVSVVYSYSAVHSSSRNIPRIIDSII